MKEGLKGKSAFYNQKAYKSIRIASRYNQLTLQIPEGALWREAGGRLEILVHRETAEGHGTVEGCDREAFDFLKNRRMVFQGGRLVQVSHMDPEAWEPLLEKEALVRVSGFFIEHDEQIGSVGLILGGAAKNGFEKGVEMSDGVFLMKGGNPGARSLGIRLDMADMRVDAVLSGGKIEALVRARQWIL